MVFRGSWQPQYVDYGVGDVVEYQGAYFEIVQPHHSQADWPPTATPALWRRVDASNHQGSQPENHPPVYGQSGPGQSFGGFAPKPEGGYSVPNGPDVHPEETKKPWYDIRGDTKSELLAAGGLAVGLGLLGGVMYKQHEKHEKQEKDDREAQAWELQNWVLNAKKNSDQFIQEGPKGPVTWILVDTIAEHPNLRGNLIQGGEEDGQPWFIARAPYHGSLQVGKCRLQHGNEYAVLGYAREAIEVKKFEVLIGAANATTWIRAHGNFDPSSVRATPIRGGHDSDESILYVARVSYRGGIHPGKCSPTLRGGCFCYDEKERSEDEYEVLCLRS